MKRSPLLCKLLLAALCLSSFALKVLGNDPPPPTVLVIALDPWAAEEGSDPATFLVIRSGTDSTPLTVQYALGGTAQNGVDYHPLSGEVTIPAGSWFAPVTVTPIDDYLVEGAESVVIALQQPAQWPPPYIVTWPSVAVAEIADNDVAPTNQPPTVALIRPPDGSIFDADDSVPMLARASDPDGRVVTVEFFADGRSLGIVTNRPVTPVTAADPTQDPVFSLDASLFPDVDTPADLSAIPLPGQLFRLVWDNPPPGDHVLTAVATDNDGASTRSGPINIKVLPPPPLPFVSIRTTDPIASEPSPSGVVDTATFKVHRTGPTNQVYYRIGGTASNGIDYVELPHSVTIPAGEHCADVVIVPLDDSLVEGPETVVLTLVPPLPVSVFPPPSDGYIVGHPDTAKAVILDNDTTNRPPLVRLVKPDDGSVFCAPADIRLVALARDYDGNVATVEFFEGTNSLGVVSNSPVASSSALPVFSLVWSNVPPGHYVLTAVATDNDGASAPSCPVEIKVVPHTVPPEVNILTLDGEAAETLPGMVPNTATFSVTRTGTTDSPLLVFYDISGTASNGVDYKLLSGRVLIPVGASSNSIVIEPIDDDLVEGPETVFIQLEPPPILEPANTAPEWWYRIGSNRLGVAVIRDNDVTVTNPPPRVAIIQPQDGELFFAPVDLKLTALAQDPGGWVRSVEFFDGGVSLGIVSNSLSATGVANPAVASPEQLFRLVWSNAPPGGHVLTAKATDNQGATSTSDPIHIRIVVPPPPVVTIEATDPFASEGCEPLPWAVATIDPVSATARPRTATFTVFRKGSTNDDLTVFYRVSGTASNGVDYLRLPGVVVIPRGQTEAKIIVVPIDDLVPEPTETVVLTLLPSACVATYPPPPGCYVVGDPSQAVAYIFDNDFNLSPKVEIVRPDDGDVFRAGADIEIDVAAQDPDGWVQTVQFYEGTNLIGEQTVNFFVPPPPGQPQKFWMVWSNVPPGGYVLTAKAIDNLGAISVSDPARIKVVALPPLPVVTIWTTDPVATEPNPLLPVTPDTAAFKVVRTGSLSDSLTVWYRIGGTASNGVDYVKLSGQVTIPANSAGAPIVVTPLPDDLVEGTETVILTLAQPPCLTSNTVTAAGCYLVGQPDSALAYIRDNDAATNRPPTVAIISPPNGAVFVAPVDIRLVAAAGDPDGWVTTVEFFDGTNSLGVVSNDVCILAAAPVRLPDLGVDALTDHSAIRPFSLLWPSVPLGHHVLTAVATDNAGLSTRSRPIEITVLDQTGVPVVNIMAVDPIAREGTDNTAAFRIRRAGSTNAPLTVFYAIGGTASNGVDYVQIPGYVTIPAGRHTVRIVIQPIDDSIPEGIETVLLHLIPPPVGPLTYQIGRPARAGALILDDDCPVPATANLNDGCLHLRLPLPLGMPYRLEASTDWQTWEAVVTDIAADTGESFVEDDQADYAQRFFRIVQEFGDVEGDD